MKRTLILLAACTGALALAGCNREQLCNEKLGIAAVEKPASETETADNNYDTPGTVERVRVHNAAVGRLCGAVRVRS
jgi:hypothetical protein